MRGRTLLGIVASTVAVALGGAAPALATTVDIPATRTCLIYSMGGGACGYLGAGDLAYNSPPAEFQGLIQFDLSSIPENAEIESATLSLAIASDYEGIASWTDLREVAEPWDDDATWLTGD